MDVACPSCGKRYQLDDSAAGKNATCKCGAKFKVPPIAPQAQVVASQPSDAPSTVPRKMSGTTLAILISVALAVPLCCCCGAPLISLIVPEDPERVAQQQAERAEREASRAAEREEREARRAEERRTRDEESKQIEAWTIAQEFVRDHLRSPSTASFGSVFSEFQRPADQVRALGDGKYRVSGWVDSQNALGATVRSNFVLELQDLGNGQWQLQGEPIFVQR